MMRVFFTIISSVSVSIGADGGGLREYPIATLRVEGS